jgi:Xaa-Pro aminopeptidase
VRTADGPAPVDTRPARLAAIRDALARADLDALLVTSLPNVRYVTGFSGSNALLTITAKDCVLLTDFRYATQVNEEVGGAATVRIESTNLWAGLWTQLSIMAGVERIGFETVHLTHHDFSRLLEQGARWSWRPTTDVVETLRAVKDAGELGHIERAIVMAESALHQTVPLLRPGLTETAVAGILEHHLRDAGSETFPFPSIVASGPRSALPHARAGIVREANRLASGAIRVGMTGMAADAVARGYIADRGFGEAFGHSLGHGIGLEVHEAPRLARVVETPLASGTVVTIEPGIYRAGWGGVRIEDNVFLSAAGPRVLTGFSRDLHELS